MGSPREGAPCRENTKAAVTLEEVGLPTIVLGYLYWALAT